MAKPNYNYEKRQKEIAKKKKKEEKMAAKQREKGNAHPAGDAGEPRQPAP